MPRGTAPSRSRRGQRSAGNLYGYCCKTRHRTIPAAMKVAAECRDPLYYYWCERGLCWHLMKWAHEGQEAN